MQNNYITLNMEFKDIKTIKKEIFEAKYVFYGVRKDIRPKCCPNCNKKSTINIHDYRQSTIRFSKFEVKSIVLIVKKQRYICKNCKKKITPSLDFVDKGCQISKNVKAEIFRKLKEIKTFTQIAKEENVSITTVERELEKYKISKSNSNVSVIHFDEFKGNAGNEKYQLAIYDKNHKLITILKDRKTPTIRPFLEKNSNEIEVVSIDMFMQFRNLIKDTLPNAEIVADKYHVIRQVDWMIRDVRINLYNSNSKYKEYKKYWKITAMNPNRKFSKKQKSILKKLRKLNKRFDKAYELRHRFYNLFNISDVDIFRVGFIELLNDLKNSEISECIKLGKTLENWKEEIINIIKYGINNGFVEGYNNKIKVIKRIAYGIKKFDNLQKLIYLRIC